MEMFCSMRTHEPRRIVEDGKETCWKVESNISNVHRKKWKTKMIEMTEPLIGTQTRTKYLQRIIKLTLIALNKGQQQQTKQKYAFIISQRITFIPISIQFRKNLLRKFAIFINCCVHDLRFNEFNFFFRWIRLDKQIFFLLIQSINGR